MLIYSSMLPFVTVCSEDTRSNIWRTSNVHLSNYLNMYTTQLTSSTSSLVASDSAEGSKSFRYRILDKDLVNLQGSVAYWINIKLGLAISDRSELHGSHCTKQRYCTILLSYVGF